MTEHVRLIILGAGTAGLSALSEASRQTDDIRLVDPGPLGTTCARVGCMPSKALLRVAHQVREGQQLREGGLVSGTGSVNGHAVMAHVRALRDRFASGPAAAVEKLGERYLRGPARLVGPDRVEVNGQVLSADAIIVATGSRPVIPQPWKALGDKLLDSDDIFELDTLPARLGVVGLGAIGTEIGQALAMLGVEVHAFAMNERIAGISDPEVNALAREALGEDLHLHMGAAVEPRRSGEEVIIAAGDEEIRVDALIAASGRAPVVEGLGLDNLGVPLDGNGLPEIDPRTLRAGDTNVFLAGDVNGVIPLMHEAADEGRLAAWHALQPEAQCLTRRTPLAMVFTTPQIARVGLGREELPDDALVASADFSRQGRAILMGEGRGLLRVYASADGRLMGGEMAVPGGEHLAHELAWLIQQETHVEDALQLPFYHPVLEEGLRTALQGLRRQLPERRRRPDLPLCGEAQDPLPGI